MITLQSNTDNEIILFLGEHPYYLFFFTQRQGCFEYADVLVNESDCQEYQKFTIDVDLSSGMYNLAIYGQQDYSNLNPDNGIFLREYKVKVINLCDFCGDTLLATSDDRFLITPDGRYIEITLNC